MITQARYPFVPVLTLYEITHYLMTYIHANGVPLQYWMMQSPKGIFWDKGISNFLICKDYIVILEHLFMAAGFDSQIGRRFLPILFLMCVLPEMIPNTQERIIGYHRPFWNWCATYVIQDQRLI